MVDKKSHMIFVGFVLVMGCVLRCWNMTQSFWWDEIWSTMTYVNTPSLWHVVSNLGYYFNNHILYSLLARVVINILGESEVAARLPALIMGLLGIIALFQYGKVFLGTRCGMIAALLLALSPFHIDHSSEARGYSGLALFAILSSFYFLKALKTNALKSWMFYSLFTVLGFYSHVFMIAVSISQFFSCVLFILGEKWGSWKTGITPNAFKNLLRALFCTGIITVLIYSPVLSAFLTNMDKVRFVDVNRVPFVLSLFSSFLPGIQSVAGGLAYGVLFFFGMYAVIRKDLTLFLYLFVLLFLPLFLYLLINPMFVFERYFIFALPFVLLIVSQGVVMFADPLKRGYKKGVVLVGLLFLMYLHMPAIDKIIHRDRQNYREAVHYVEGKIENKKKDLVFSLGYAGDHFRYYSSELTIATPESLDEFSKMARGKKHIWCLVTAWLPDLCPPHEDKALYAERPGQVELYDYVKSTFTLKKVFPSKYPVKVYCLRR